MVISEEEYLHFEIVGNAHEADVVPKQKNRNRHVQDSEEDHEPESDGRGRPWTDEDTEKLAELAATLETPDAQTIGLMMERHPQLIYRKASAYGIQLMSKPRGRKPKQQ